MIKYATIAGDIWLDVQTPHEVGEIQFENSDSDPLAEGLKDDFSKGWVGMFGHTQYLKTTALDLAHVFATNENFSSYVLELKEGQEILDMYKDDEEEIIY